MDNDLILEDTAFNVNHWARLTQDQLIQEGKDLFKGYREEDRLVLLKMVYDLIRAERPVTGL